MSSLKERLEKLKQDLTQRPLRHAIYSDLPFAVFCFPPGEEWQMRGEIQRLKTRLERETDRGIHFISLANLLWQSLDESKGMQALIDVEVRQGFDAAQKRTYDYLSD